MFYAQSTSTVISGQDSDVECIAAAMTGVRNVPAYLTYMYAGRYAGIKKNAQFSFQQHVVLLSVDVFTSLCNVMFTNGPWHRNHWHTPS